MEDIQKGITTKNTTITISDTGDDSKVYWKLFFQLNPDVTFFEDQPERELQYQKFCLLISNGSFIMEINYLLLIYP